MPPCPTRSMGAGECRRPCGALVIRVKCVVTGSKDALPPSSRRGVRGGVGYFEQFLFACFSLFFAGHWVLPPGSITHLTTCQHRPNTASGKQKQKHQQHSSSSRRADTETNGLTKGSFNRRRARVLTAHVARPLLNPPSSLRLPKETGAVSQ